MAPIEQVLSDFATIAKTLRVAEPAAAPTPPVLVAPAAPEQATPPLVSSATSNRSSRAADAAPVTLDTPDIFLALASVVPEAVPKELPVAGESSKVGTSELWRQLRARDSSGQLVGICSHQGSLTSAPLHAERAAHARTG